MNALLRPLLCCVLLLAPTLAARAAGPANATAPAGGPGAAAPVNATASAPLPGRVIPVDVQHAGSDLLGPRLALELKERLNISSLFVLTPADTPKLKLVLRTTEEFPGRPGLGAAVSVAWVFSGGAGLLGHHLDGMVAVTDAAGVAALVSAIAARTDEVAGSYAYLFAK
ncbi:MAG: hypothetical protein AB1916_01900 [Thermodesulfobacteriota bacterium]